MNKEELEGKTHVKIWAGGAGGEENYEWCEVIDLSEEFAVVAHLPGLEFEEVDYKYIVNAITGPAA